MGGVDYVFSAAALKQVPSCEFFPDGGYAYQRRGYGETCCCRPIEHGVKSVVVLSTDKAAYPINAMGISKALMEKVAIAKGRELGEGAATNYLLHTLWQRDGFARLGNTVVGRADEGREAYNDNRP